MGPDTKTTPSRLPAPPRANLGFGRRSIASKLAAIVLVFVCIILALLAIMTLSMAINTGVRAYVGAEGLWSKGQKDAVYYLTRYARTRDEQDYRKYLEAIAIPLGDQTARLEMQKPSYDRDVAHRGFVQGANSVEDVPYMIFVFRNFNEIPHLAKAIRIWTEADAHIARLTQSADELHTAIRSGTLTADRATALLSRIEDINARLTPLEHDFSVAMGEGARWIRGVILITIFSTAALLLAGGLWVSLRITQGLRSDIWRLREGALRVAQGDLDHPIAVQSQDELGELAAVFNDMITQRREVEAAREQAEETLRNKDALLRAIHLHSIVSVTDRAGLIVDANDGFCKISGYSREELLGQTHRVVNSGVQSREFWVEMWRTITDGQPWRGEICNRTKEGSLYWVDSIIAPFVDEDGHTKKYISVRTDVTARKQAEEALLKAGALQRAIFNSANFSSIATDAKGVIQIFNVGAERMLGYAAAEVTNKITPADISDPQEVIARAKALSAELGTPITPGFEALVFKASRGIEDIYELSYIRKDGSRFPAVVSVTALRDAQNTIIGYLLIGTDNTARKQAEEALLKAGALQSAIFNSANFSSIATDAKGVIQIFNVGAERMLGYTASEVMNKITPADISDPREVIARAKTLSLELGTPITPGFEALVFKASRGIEDIYELTYIRKDGSRFPAVVSVTALRDAQEAIIGYLLIGTEVKAGALQSAIFNSANFSSIATDAKGVIQIFNVGAERMLGYAAAEVTNKITPADISDPQEVIARARALSLEFGTPIAPGFEALVFKAARGIEDIYELTYIRKDGSRFGAVVSVTALRDAQETIIGYLLIGTDNTARQQVEAERVRLEQVLHDKNAELESAKVVAEKASFAKSDFLSSMSHELRSPLNAILGFAQLMDSDSPPASPAQKSSIGQILHAGWYLLELINEILDLSAVESGKLALSEEPVSLTDIMLECQAMMEPQGQIRGITLTFPKAGAPCFVVADQTRLKQVLINLLSNAIKYNRPGGTVVVDFTTTDRRTRINIRDTGAGLSAEGLTQLFQPFNRLGRESGSEEGTGIGLVMSKRLVEMMGGTIGVDSAVGVGSVFWFELNSVAAMQLTFPSAKPAAVAQTHVQQGALLRTLLYVEDNPANLKLVEQLVARRPDLRLLTAVNGNMGVELARIHRPEVILMDINLPGISGIQALKILLEDPLTAHIPVLAISANAMPGDIRKGLEAGFFRYLTKPIEVNAFMAALDVALEFAKDSPDKRG